MLNANASDQQFDAAGTICQPSIDHIHFCDGYVQRRLASGIDEFGRQVQLGQLRNGCARNVNYGEYWSCNDQGV